MTKRELFFIKRNNKIKNEQLKAAEKKKRKKFELNLNKRRLYMKMMVDNRIKQMSEKDKPNYKVAIISSYRKKIEKIRKKILIDEHKKYNYTLPEKKVTVCNEFGIEQGGIINFVKNAVQIIDFNTQKLTIDLQKCTKMWPSAITLLCSLVEWVEFGAKYIEDIKVPNIVSTYSKIDRVNGYLIKSGFYNFIGKSETKQIPTGHPHHVIKIEREYTKDSKVVSKKEDDIIKLLVDNTQYTPAEVKSFVSNVIIEVFGNIQEHGIQVNDSGWWFLAQFHSNHKIASINIADNGIGIKNSLLSGPQKRQIKSELKEKTKLDGDMIKYAMMENVSGALGSKIDDKYRKFYRGYSLFGQRRGNGLERIRETCLKLCVAFAIISHHGYIYYDALGKMSYGTEENRIFAGTLYHFDFPVSRSIK